MSSIEGRYHIVEHHYPVPFEPNGSLPEGVIERVEERAAAFRANMERPRGEREEANLLSVGSCALCVIIPANTAQGEGQHDNDGVYYAEGQCVDSTYATHRGRYGARHDAVLGSISNFYAGHYGVVIRQNALSTRRGSLLPILPLEAPAVPELGLDDSVRVAYLRARMRGELPSQAESQQIPAGTTDDREI